MRFQYVRDKKSERRKNRSKFLLILFQIQRMVISGGNFKPDTLKPKEVVSLLLDDEEIVTKCKFNEYKI